jgi:anti-sigma B factor antagonist
LLARSNVDSLFLGTENFVGKGFLVSFKATSREVGDVTVIDMDGRITLGEGSALLRDLIRENLANGHRKIVMNLAGINYIDSSGLGELVSGYRLIKSEGGEVKLLNLNKKVTDLLQITKLYTVFDVHNEEAEALASFER